MKLKKENLEEDSSTESSSLMPENVSSKSPNELLAEVLSEALTSAGVVPENRKAELLSKLKAGGVKREDWGLWVDVATASKETRGRDHE